MDITLILGIVLTFVVMVVAIIIGGGDIVKFLDWPSVFIVFVAIITIFVASFPLSRLKKIPSHLKVAMAKDTYDPKKYIETIVSLSLIARQQGLTALENEEENISDAFLLSAVRKIVDGTESSKMVTALQGEIIGVNHRHAEAWAIYDKGSALAPGCGMIGTIIGLVNMLMSMDFSDSNGVTNLATNMGVALITTLYGSLLANVVFGPISNRLRLLHKSEMFCKELVIAGALSILSGENPRTIESDLMARLNERDTAEGKES